MSKSVSGDIICRIELGVDAKRSRRGGGSGELLKDGAVEACWSMLKRSESAGFHAFSKHRSWIITWIIYHDLQYKSILLMESLLEWFKAVYGCFNIHNELTRFDKAQRPAHCAKLPAAKAAKTQGVPGVDEFFLYKLEAAARPVRRHSDSLIIPVQGYKTPEETDCPSRICHEDLCVSLSLSFFYVPVYCIHAHRPTGKQTDRREKGTDRHTAHAYSSMLYEFYMNIRKISLCIITWGTSKTATN